MKAIIILGVICALTMQQTVLIRSTNANTIVTAPPHQVTATEPYYSLHFPNKIGYEAQWIYKNGTGVWPAGDYAVFYTTFYADCQLEAILIIEADDQFSASLNGGQPYKGSGLNNVFKFYIKNLKCGVNTLTIKVTNTGKNTRGALIFAVVQDQSKCYNCKSPLSFYNRRTCQCECVDKCSCSSRHRYFYFDYPICGCKCIETLSCPTNHYFNADTCTCECKPTACLPGYAQSSSSCLCAKK